MAPSSRNGTGKGKKRARSRSRKKTEDASLDESDLNHAQQQDLELSDTQRDEIQKAFDLFDTKENGLISCNEIKYAIESMGLGLNKDELNYWLALLQRQKSNSNSRGGTKKRSAKRRAEDSVLLLDVEQMVDINFFTRIAASKLKEVEKSKLAFRLLDTDGKGFITTADLRRAANELSEENITDDDLQEMIDEVDSKGHGIVNQDDFFRLTRKLNL
mmetsp:Transcript_3917/g.5662  ORF Transcript_3917/g.5662 Transcript_3917/m.5662 type:complete len:216 (+) Transcript_3917:230-877(+)